MAVPTIVSLDPATVPSRGDRVVTVVGTNFRLPDPPALTGFVGGEETKTVKVEVDGIESEDVRVYTDSLLAFLSPEYRGNSNVAPIPAVDIRVANLDNAGDEIVGETVTAAGAVTFVRPSLSVESDLRRLIRELIRLFKRHVHPNTVLTVHTDYGEPGSEETMLSKLPGVVLSGPSLPENRFYSVNHKPETDLGAGEFERRRDPKTVDLVFGVTGVTGQESGGTMGLINLLGGVEGMMKSFTRVEIDRDPSDPAQGKVGWDFRIADDFAVESRANESNVRHFTGAVEVVGFDIETDILERGFEVDDLSGLDLESI